MNNVPGLRPATLSDAPAVALLINRAFSVESSFKKGDRTNPQQVREKMSTGSFFVVKEGSALIGCIYIEVAQPGNDHTIAKGEGAGYIGMLAIDPAQQGKGMGKRLMRFAEQELKDRGCTRVQLRIIHLRQELYSFYKAQGYRETGTSPYPFPEGTSRPVHFVNMEKALV